MLFSYLNKGFFNSLKLKDSILSMELFLTKSPIVFAYSNLLILNLSKIRLYIFNSKRNLGYFNDYY